MTLRPWLALALLTACGNDDDDVTTPDAAADAAPALDATADAPAPPADPYVLEPLVDARVSSDPESPTFQHVRGDVDLVDGPFARVTLVVDLATTCFPFSSWADNPPPFGENWPADCDAFDRNFEIRLDPPQDDGDPPAIELVRAITPFGGPLRIEQDVTDIANGRPGAHVLDVTIGTWSDPAGIVSGSAGGWNVTARLEVEPGAPPRTVLAVVPLLDASVTSPDQLVPLALEVPEGTTAARLEWRATGHGGGEPGRYCRGPAEEFCSRIHALEIDGSEVASFEPWRDDCDDLCTIAHEDQGDFDYCAENPCGAIESVRAPRANWCPGSVTAPEIWEHAPLRAPGPHEVRPTIDTILPGGSWRVSLLYVAFGS